MSSLLPSTVIYHVDIYQFRHLKYNTYEVVLKNFLFFFSFLPEVSTW